MINPPRFRRSPPFPGRTNNEILKRLVLAPPEQTIKPSAMLSSRKIEAWQPTFERCIGACMLGLSIAGTIALFNGRWGQPGLAAFCTGLFIQSVLTFVEWLYRRRRLSWQYGVALVLDTGLSMGGYIVVVMPGLARLCDRAGLTGVAGQGVALLVILLGSVLLAYIPERIFVQD